MASATSFLQRLVKKEWFWLLLITLLALALRLYRLGAWSLWGDEASNILDSLGVFELTFRRRAISRILSRAVMVTWGVSEWHARLAPALIGVITIPLAYLPLRKAAGRRVALLAMLFLAVSPWHLYWSQNARFYTGALFFYTLSLLTFFFFLEEDRLIYLLAAAALLVLAVQEHLTSLILIPVAAAYILLLWVGPWARPPGLRRRNLLLLGLPGAAIALLMALPFVTNPFIMNVRFATPNISPVWLVGGTVYYIGIPFVVAAAAGFLLGWSEKNRATLLFGLGAAIPLLVVATISLFQYSANRYVFVSLTSWLVLAAVAVDGLARQVRPPNRWLAGLLVAVLLATALGENVLYFRFQNGNRENWRAALAWVTEHKEAGDQVILADNRVGSFYLDDESSDVRSYELSQLQEIAVPTWYVIDMNLPATHPDIVEWIRREATLQATFDVNFRARTFAMRVYKLDP